MAYGSHRQHIQMALPNPSKLFTPGVSVILGLIVVGYALVSYFPKWVIGDLNSNPMEFGYLALIPQTVLRGRLWQLITYAFIDGCAWTMIWHMLVVLLFGSAIEREWRTRSFLLMLFMVILSCGVVWTGVSLVFGRNFIGLGSHSLAYGIIGAFGLLFRRQRILVFFWGMEAQYLCMLVVGIGIIIGIGQPISWIWVAGAGVGFLYTKLRTGSSFHRPRKQAEDASRFLDID